MAKETPKKVAPKKVAPKAAKVDFDDKQEIVVELKGKEYVVSGSDAKAMIKIGRAKFIKIAD